MKTKLVVVAITDTATSQVRHMGYFGHPDLVSAMTAGAKEDPETLIVGEFELDGLIAVSVMSKEDAEAQGLLDGEDDDNDGDDEDNG